LVRTRLLPDYPAILALSLVLPAWLAALIVAVVVAIAARIAALMGKEKVAEAGPLAPTDTVKVSRKTSRKLRRVPADSSNTPQRAL
jgi:hypothetical protein